VRELLDILNSASATTTDSRRRLRALTMAGGGVVTRGLKKLRGKKTPRGLLEAYSYAQPSDMIRALGLGEGIDESPLELRHLVDKFMREHYAELTTPEAEAAKKAVNDFLAEYDREYAATGPDEVSNYIVSAKQAEPAAVAFDSLYGMWEAAHPQSPKSERMEVMRKYNADVQKHAADDEARRGPEYAAWKQDVEAKDAAYRELLRAYEQRPENKQLEALARKYHAMKYADVRAPGKLDELLANVSREAEGLVTDPAMLKAELDRASEAMRRRLAADPSILGLSRKEYDQGVLNDLAGAIRTFTYAPNFVRRPPDLEPAPEPPRKLPRLPEPKHPLGSPLSPIIKGKD